MAEQNSLSRRAAGAVGWSMMRYGGDQVFGFIVFATLAHKLNPATFGVFVVGLAVIEVGRIIAQAGLVSSLYRAEIITPRLADTIFWANMAIATTVALICVVCRNPLATMMGSPNAAPVIAVMGLLIPLSASGATHMSRNLRNFGHRALAIRSLLAGVIGGGLALVAAQAGWGVWALVVQRLVGELIGAVVAWRTFPWRPGFDFSWSTLRDQWRLGASSAGSQLLLVTLTRAQDVIVSRTLGIGAVGVFRTASKPIDFVTQFIISSYFAVASPTLVKIKHDEAAFSRGYIRMVSYCSMLMFPAVAGIGTLADPLIPLVFGEQWTQGIPIARALCFMAPIYALGLFIEPALTVLGKAGVIAKLTGTQLILTLVLCTLAAPYGLFWFAIACVVRSQLAFVLQLTMLQRATGIRAKSVLAGIAPPVAASLIMAAVVWMTGKLMPMPSTSHLLPTLFRLGLLCLQGVAVYGIALLVLLGPTRRAELLGMARKTLARTRSTA